MFFIRVGGSHRFVTGRLPNEDLAPCSCPEEAAFRGRFGPKVFNVFGTSLECARLFEKPIDAKEHVHVLIQLLQLVPHHPLAPEGYLGQLQVSGLWETYKFKEFRGVAFIPPETFRPQGDS